MRANVAAWVGLIGASIGGALAAGCGRLGYDAVARADAGGMDSAPTAADAAADAPLAAVDAGPCVPDEPCTPAGHPCSTGRTSCTSGVRSCVAAGTLATGADCGGGGTCTASGVCDRAVQRRVLVSGAADRAEVGFSVATDGTRAVAGARYVSAGALRTGAAFLLERTESGDWTVLAQLTASDAGAQDEFGSAVAIDGDTIMVGAHYWDGPTVTDTGAVYIYERRADGTWPETSRIALDQRREFGNAIALRGTRAVVGAEYDDGPGALLGAVHVLERGPTGWAVVARLTHPAGDRLGRSVALDGDRIVAGSLWEVGAGTGLDGAAHVWERAADGTWAEVARLRPTRASASQAFGSSVAIAGDRVVVGAQNHEQAGLRNTGLAYVFERDGVGAWTQTAVLEDPVPAADAGLGRSIGMRGDTVVLPSLVYGATTELRVHAFSRLPDGSWARVAELGDASDAYGGGSAIGGIEVDIQIAWRGDALVVGMPLLADAAAALPGGVLVLDASGL